MLIVDKVVEKLVYILVSCVNHNIHGFYHILDNRVFLKKYFNISSLATYPDIHTPTTTTSIYI